jgi:hypothetical protein
VRPRPAEKDEEEKGGREREMEERSKRIKREGEAIRESDEEKRQKKEDGQCRRKRERKGKETIN